MTNLSIDPPKIVLFISPVVPDNNGSGVQRRAYMHLNYLLTRYVVDCVLFASDVNFINPDIANKLRRFIIIPTPAPSRNNLTALGRHLYEQIFFPMRFLQIPFNSDISNARISIQNNCYDLIFCFRIRSVLVGSQLLNDPLFSIYSYIIDFDDIESQLYSRNRFRNWQNFGIEISLVKMLQARYLRMIESSLIRRRVSILICSTRDRDHILRTPQKKALIHVVPNTVFLPSRQTISKINSIGHILFVGTLSYLPNVDAIIWFVESVMPLIKKRTHFIPRLTIVGANPPSRVSEFTADPDIVITGRVRDLLPYYRSADIVVAPIRFGSGTRIKILEAMSMSRAVVTTTIGVEGIDVTPGLNAMVADQPCAFANACIALMHSDDDRKTLAECGYDLVQRKYQHRIADAQLAEIINNAIPGASV